MRFASFLALALLIFGLFNVVAIRTLLRLHPRRKRFVLGAAVLGNLMWLFFPLLRTLTSAGRITRAAFGPPWFSWQSFTILYTAFVILVALVWLPFHRRISFAAFARTPSRFVLI